MRELLSLCAVLPLTQDSCVKLTLAFFALWNFSAERVKIGVIVCACKKSVRVRARTHCRSSKFYTVETVSSIWWTPPHPHRRKPPTLDSDLEAPELLLAVRRAAPRPEEGAGAAGPTPEQARKN